MIISRTLFAALLASLSLTACVADDEPESFDETTSELSSSSWTAPVDVDWQLDPGHDVSYPPAMAMLDGVEYYVYASGTNINPWADHSHQLYWHQCDATGACTDSRPIPGQLSLGRVNVAAFNGRIHMVHQGDSNDRAVWYTRLDPTTGQWTENIELAVETIGGSPALAAFNNKLYMVGSREVEVTRHGVTTTTYPLWYATMGADWAWAPMKNISSESVSPPSIAVLGNRLYLAHQYGATPEIAVRSIGVTGGWSAPARIPAGPSNSYIQGDDVQLAAVNGHLHLVHQRFSGNLTYWTYNRGCDNWAPEVSVDAFASSSASSLATGINGLVLTRLNDTGLWPYTVYSWYRSRFIAPPPPDTLPNCGAQQ